MLEGGLGDADPAGVRQGFQARRDVHPVTVDAVSLLDDIPQVDPDAELHPPVLWKFGVAGFNLLLHRHPALDRIHDAGKLREDIVPWRRHYSPSVLFDEDEHDLFVGFEMANPPEQGSERLAVRTPKEEKKLMTIGGRNFLAQHKSSAFVISSVSSRLMLVTARDWVCAQVPAQKKESTMSANSLFFLAGSKGLEPSASGVTGRRYNQLNYDPDIVSLVGGTGFEPATPGL